METCTLVTCVVCGKSDEAQNMCAVRNKNYPEATASVICVKCIRAKPKT